MSEAFTLQDSDGGFFRASLLSCGSRGAEAEVYEAMARPPESPLRLSLVCAVLGRQRMIFVSQKATELGVDRILPVFTERSVGPEGLDHEKAHAWPGQAVRASRQCRRATVPEVRPTLPLAEALDGDVWRAAGARFFLDDAAAETARLQPGVRSACLAVGPEGGWTDEEKQLLLAAGAAPLNLGGRVLRAETAVVVGLALLQHRLGDLAREP